MQALKTNWLNKSHSMLVFSTMSIHYLIVLIVLYQIFFFEKFELRIIYYPTIIYSLVFVATCNAKVVPSHFVIQSYCLIPISFLILLFAPWNPNPIAICNLLLSYCLPKQPVALCNRFCWTLQSINLSHCVIS